VRWKRFTAEHDSWEKKEDQVVEELKGRINDEVRRQEKLDMAEKRDFRRRKLPVKYTAKMLYGWNNRKFEKEYLRKLERNWKKWKSVSPKEKP